MNNMDIEKLANEEMKTDINKVVASFLTMSSLSPDGGYGGVSMCITCKKNGWDKIEDEETGQTINFCEHCPNCFTKRLDLY